MKKYTWRKEVLFIVMGIIFLTLIPMVSRAETIPACPPPGATCISGEPHLVNGECVCS